MELCNPDSVPPDIKPALLTAALVAAQAYSNEAYGSDCFVCAQVLGDEAGEFTLHITSPLDLLLNTSATITVRKSDAAVIERAKYHSCHARRTNVPGP